VDSEYIPNISAKYPLCVSGRYHGQLPETLTVKGQLADMSKISIELKVQHIKAIPLDKVRYSLYSLFLTQLIFYTIALSFWLIKVNQINKTNKIAQVLWWIFVSITDTDIAVQTNKVSSICSTWAFEVISWPQAIYSPTKYNEISLLICLINLAQS
jgi:hypothetical protein